HLGLAADKTTPGSTLTLWGLEGTLRYTFHDQIEIARKGQPLATAQVPPEELRPWQVERDFVEAVVQARAGKRWHVSPDFAEGIEYMKKVEAVHLSAASRKEIQLSEL